MKKRKFTKWILSSIVLGLLPWMINLLVVFISSGNMGLFNIFRISDLNFFVIILCAYTLMDISDRIKYTDCIILGGFLIISSLLLGICLFNQNFPISSDIYLPFLLKITWISITISIMALFYTLVIQWRHYNNIKQSHGQTIESTF